MERGEEERCDRCRFGLQIKDDANQDAIGCFFRPETVPGREPGTSRTQIRTMRLEWFCEHFRPRKWTIRWGIRWMLRSVMGM